MAEANAEFLKTHLPYVEVFCLKDGIHNLELQKPEEVARIILEFFHQNPSDVLVANPHASCQQ
jgi:hypothetical protein